MANASATPSAGPGKLRWIEVMRGLAAILVLLNHNIAYPQYVANIHFLRFGALGVDFFFVLSGFIVFYVHGRDPVGWPRFRSFILKRFVRIYPAYIIITIGVIAAMGLFLQTTYPLTLWSAIKSITLFPQEPGPALLVGWSLEHEVYYYLLFSLFLLSRTLSLAVLAIISIGTIYACFLPPDNFFVEFAFSPWNINFLLGVGIAWLIRSGFKRGYALILPAALVTFVGLVILYQTTDMIGEIHRVICFALVFAATIYGLASFEIDTRIRPQRLLVFFGAASYSIYLIHYPVISLTDKILDRLGVLQILPFWVAFIVISAVSLAAGCLFHVVIEKPITGWLRTVLKLREGGDGNRTAQIAPIMAEEQAP